MNSLLLFCRFGGIPRKTGLQFSFITLSSCYVFAVVSSEVLDTCTGEFLLILEPHLILVKHLHIQEKQTTSNISLTKLASSLR